MNPRATNVSYQHSHRLIVTFSDGKVKEFDLQPYLHYPVYQPLQSESFCSKATIQNGTVTWSEEIDIDPDRLYLEGRELRNEKV